METVKSSESQKFNIDFSLLHEKELEELMLFYKYLLYKTEQSPEIQQNNNKKKQSKLPETFYSPIKVKTYQKFYRDEIYTDR